MDSKVRIGIVAALLLAAAAQAASANARPRRLPPVA